MPVFTDYQCRIDNCYKFVSLMIELTAVQDWVLIVIAFSKKNPPAVAIIVHPWANQNLGG